MLVELFLYRSWERRWIYHSPPLNHCANCCAREEESQCTAEPLSNLIIAEDKSRLHPSMLLITWNSIQPRLKGVQVRVALPFSFCYLPSFLCDSLYSQQWSFRNAILNTAVRTRVGPGKNSSDIVGKNFVEILVQNARLTSVTSFYETVAAGGRTYSLSFKALAS